MARRLFRTLLRQFGYDAMERERFDLLRAGEQVVGTHRQVLQDFFDLYTAQTEHVYLLQLGANDGVKDDSFAFIRECPKVESILVEPQRECVARLAQLQTRNPRIRILPFAFGKSPGTAAMFRFDREIEKGIQLNVFTSFDQSLVEAKRRYFDLSANIVGEEVELCTLPMLQQRGGAPRIDILLCDIEGLDDFVIHQLIATTSPLPVIVVFEHRWLGAARRAACYSALTTAGYGILHGTEDAICFRARREGERKGGG